jgi:hypothetical protein
MANIWRIFPTLGKWPGDEDVPSRDENGGFAPLPRLGTALVRKRAQPLRRIREFREETMFNTGKITQAFLAVVLAAAFSATAVGAAVGPAHALETSRIA